MKFVKGDPRAVECGRKGGACSGGNFRNQPEKAVTAGRKGGQRTPSNFAHDPARAAAAGRKGGTAHRRSA